MVLLPLPWNLAAPVDPLLVDLDFQQLPYGQLLNDVRYGAELARPVSLITFMSFHVSASQCSRAFSLDNPDPSILRRRGPCPEWRCPSVQGPDQTRTSRRYCGF